MEPIDDQSSPSVDDTIEICERVDSGLYGSVYRAIQKPFGRQVAVKIIKTDLKAADALSHAAPLARINHPSIVTVYTVQEVYIPELGRTVPAIIMEWVHGETFGKRLSGDKFKLAEAVLLCRDLLDGIYHLHANGLCHGDLHPGNIIILPNGHVKVIDIDANKEISLARLSALSREGAKSSDVDYCRGIIFKALRHSDVPLSILSDCETALQEASSIVSLQKEIDLVVLQAQYLDVNPVIEDKVFKPEPNRDWLDETAKFDATPDQVIALLDTQTYFDLLKVTYPTSRDEVLSRLASERVIFRTSLGWDITNLAAILLAKRLDAFELSLARKAARFIIYDGASKLKTKSDLPGNRGYAVGFKALIEFVHNAAPKNEYVELAVREEIKMFPIQALRELIANALVHQDFSAQGTSVMIEMYSDRVEISNPGLPTIPTDRFIDEHRSRNERLAELMRRLGICEEKGSGIDKVINAAEVYQLPAPDFRVGEIRTTAVLFAHQEFAEMSKSARIRACYQHCVLQYLGGKRMSNQSLRERFGLINIGSGSATTSQVIAAAKDAKLIKSDDDGAGSLRYARYLPCWG